MLSTQKFRSYAAVATLAVALAPAASFGVSYDINRDYQAPVPGGGTVATGGVLPDSTGDTVLYPFYTTVGGASTTFELTNTSISETVAAKVRFRDQERSRDVLDFIVVLSPNDKFSWFVSDVGGVPTVQWYDNSCVVGYPGTPFDNLKVLPFVDPSISGVDYADSAVGHVEVIGMLNLNEVESGGAFELAVAASHRPAANGQSYPVNCGALKAAFKNRDEVNALKLDRNQQILSQNEGALQLADVGNVLTGSQFVTVGASGVEAGTDAIVIRNTFERGFLAAQSPQACTGDTLTWNQVEQGTDECYSLYTWDTGEESHPSLADINWVGPLFITGTTGTNTVAVLDELLAAQNGLAGEWSNNATFGVGFDWVISLISKYVYLDISASCALGNVGNKLTGQLACGTSPFTSSACVGGVSTEPYLDIYGVDEESTTTESPGTNPLQALCKEVQMVTITKDGETPQASLIQTDAKRITVPYDPSLDDSVRGWAFIPFAWQDNANVPTHSGNSLEGAAVSPLLWYVRATNDPSRANGSLRGLSRMNGID